MASFFRQKINVERLPELIRYKWGDPALDEGLTGVPKKLVRNLAAIFPGATGMEQLQVALTLVDYRREKEKRYPTPEFLAFLSGLPEDVFMARLDELKARNLIDYAPVRQAIRFDVSGLLNTLEHLTKWKPEPTKEPATGDEKNDDQQDEGDLIPF